MEGLCTGFNCASLLNARLRRTSLPTLPRCIPDVPDECQEHNGGCWEADLRVGASTRHFTACQDNLEAYKSALAQGPLAPGTEPPPLHVCACPPCFEATAKGCRPKCDLRYCNNDLKACIVPGGAGERVGGVVWLLKDSWGARMSLHFAHSKATACWLQAKTLPLTRMYTYANDARPHPSLPQAAG